MGEAVVALAEAFPFAGGGGEAGEFAVLPFEAFAFDLQLLALFFGGFECGKRRLAGAVGGGDFLRQRQAAGEGVEQFALGGFAVERLVGVLAVDVDQAAADAFELGEGGGLAVEVAAAFAFGVDDAAHGQFVGIVGQKALFAQFVLQLGHCGEVEQG